jgi:xylitol oxidase
VTDTATTNDTIRRNAMTEMSTPERNWAGNYTYRAEKLHRPQTLEELQEIVTKAPSVRALGSRHSFNDIADSSELISLETLTDVGSLPEAITVDRQANTVSFGGGVKYGELVETLNDEGLALHNMASLPHITVAGSISTATHGSGVRHGNLATAVAGLELVTSSGEVVRVSRGDPDFDGMVVGLGALGVITRVTLDVQPAYEVEQRVYEGLSWDAVEQNFEEIASIANSVSFFTHWGEIVEQVWVKRRTDEPDRVEGDLFGAVPATAEMHPTGVMDPTPCTPQLGRPGPWSDRIPHFRMGFTPSSGEEIQSEYLLPRRHAVEAFAAVRGLSSRIQPLLFVTEIRTVAADQLWMSMNYREDSVALHFTWKREQDAVERITAEIEEALAPFQMRPHWGKLFHMNAATIATLYERHGDFVRLQERLDPRGAFRNQWLQSHVLGNA